MDYDTENITEKMLLDACLKHKKFVDAFPAETLAYKSAYIHYVKFLERCSGLPNEVLLPSKLADFMWHAHMQDPDAYKKDMKAMLGVVLDHCSHEEKLGSMSKKLKKGACISLMEVE